jgi:poly(3-hydroxybutyrate) depolymerase
MSGINLKSTVAAIALLIASVLGVSGTVVARAQTAPGPVVNATTNYTLASGRDYQLRTDLNRQTAVPLVVALHGFGGTASDLSASSGLSPFMDGKGWALAYGHAALPERAWNSGEGLDASPQDDIAYLRQVVADAATRTPIDMTRIYVWGHSNGGMMAERAMCQAPDLFAAAASMSGPLASQTYGTCGTGPFNVYHMHGTSDTVVPFFGGTGVNNVNFAPAYNIDQRKGNRVPGTVVVYPIVGGDHSYSSLANDAFYNFDKQFSK